MKHAQMEMAGTFVAAETRAFLLAFILVLHSTYVSGYKPNQQPIKIGFIHGKNPKLHYLGAFLYALQVNNQSFSSGEYYLDYMYDVGQYTAASIRAITRMERQNASVIIGPENACETEARVAGAWNLAMISFNCADSRLSNKKSYPTFARTLPSTSKISKSILSMMKSFKWTRFTLVAQNSTHWQETADTLKELSMSNDLDLHQAEFYPELYGTSQTQNTMRDIVDKTYKSTRIYVILGIQDAVVDFVREIYNRGFFERCEYVVVAVNNEPFVSSMKEKYFMKFMEWRHFKASYMDPFKCTLMLLPRGPSDPRKYDYFLDQTRAFASLPPFNAPTPPPKFSGLKLPVPLYAAHLYDAVSVYVRALKEVLYKGLDPRNGSAVISRVKSRSYDSIQGYEMFIDKNGDTEGNYTLLALKPNKALRHGKGLKQVGNFTMTENGLGIPIFNYHDPVEWPSGIVPSSQPECGFDGELCNKEPDYIAISVCCMAVTVLVLVTVFGCRHYLYEQKLASLLWKVDFKDLMVTDTAEDGGCSERVRKKNPHLRRMSFLSYYDLNSSEHRPSHHPNHTSTVRLASYRGTVVALKASPKKHVEITRGLKKELQVMKEMSHDNINRFIGACVDPPNIFILTQYCSRGSLQDILENDDLHLDDMFIASLVLDLIKGMIFLHDSVVGFHGNLKTSNCLVDSRWVLQIADFGLHQFKENSREDVTIFIEEESFYEKLLWRAPELLRGSNLSSCGTHKGDVYSFALILYEIHCRQGPWGPTTFSAKEIIDKVRNPEKSWVFRPNVTQLTCGHFIIKCMQDSWQEDPELRPDFKLIRMALKPMQKGLRSNIFDNMLSIMEKYALNLEELVEERTFQLNEEKKRTEALLLRMLPTSVAEVLKQGQAVVPEHYDAVTIYFSDIAGFTTISAQSTPMQVVDMLNDLYICFDSIVGEYDVYKVETIGDAYMVVSGLPIRNGDNHAGEIASMSLHLLRAIKNFKIRHRADEQLQLRIGIHSGSCVTGVVGIKMPRYCLFGDTVNTASRMESTGLALKIHVSRSCKHVLDKLGGYILEERGKINVKGKGEMITYFLLGEDKSHRLHRISKDSQNPSHFGDDMNSSISNISRSRSTLSIQHRRSFSARSYSSCCSLEKRTYANQTTSASHLKLELNHNHPQGVTNIVSSSCQSLLDNADGHDRPVPYTQTAVNVDDSANLIPNGNDRFGVRQYLNVDINV